MTTEISPKRVLTNRDILLSQPLLKGWKQAMPDLGLAFLAVALQQNGFRVEFLDCICQDITETEFFNFVRERQFGAIGFKLFSMDMDTVRRWTDTIRQICPQTIVLLGGPHPSCSPDDVLETFPSVDFAFRGEAEEGLPRLLELLETGTLAPEQLSGVPGLIYRQDGSVRVNEQGQIQDLATLGLPAWELMDPRAYQHFENLWIFQKRPVVAPLHISRGCPFSCGFCSAHTISGRKVRFRPIELVIEEIKLLHRNYGVEEFHITDDYFSSQREYVLKFCQALERLDFDISWCCPIGIRIEALTPEIVRAMEKAGCYGTSVGIESGSTRILKLINKQIKIDQVRQNLEMIAQETNWLIQGFFILGLPSETREEIKATIDFACSLPLHLAAFSPFRVSKGTALYDYLIEQNEISEVNWSAVNVDQIGYAPKGMTIPELITLRRQAYVKFYSKPSRAFALLKQLRYPRQRKVFFEMAKRRLLP
ncbi:cobalamin-dependent protein [bacterium]|nr:cobalamin-dependent protein [bacterium]